MCKYCGTSTCANPSTMRNHIIDVCQSGPVKVQASILMACFLDARMTKHTGFAKENDTELFFDTVENMRGVGEAGIRFQK